MVVAQEVVCSCGSNTFGTCATFEGVSRVKEHLYCPTCTGGGVSCNATLCRDWRLMKSRKSSKGNKMKQLLEDAAAVREPAPPQTPSSGARAGDYNEGKVFTDWARTKRRISRRTPVAELTCCCGVERCKVCLLQSIASVCLLLRHFIHVTDNFCHLFCPFSQVVPWDFLSALSSDLSPLYPPCSDFLSALSSSSPLTCLRWDPLVYPPCSV